tara:strand:+ start:239 stop:463 length:225 start_codon:yes stop_codon:yes gene_type:complete
MTKASIVQRLLDEKKITAEEAVILLKESNDTYIPYNPNVNPYFPEGPNRTIPPVWCSNNSWEYSDTKFTPPTEK